jgi:RHS repeat-associated protein
MGEFGVMRVNDSVLFVRARYLDLTKGRFFNRDPYEYDLNNPQTLNRYVYSLNSAVNMFDYSGLYGGRDGSYISAPNNNFFYKLSSSVYNFGLGAINGAGDALSFKVFKPGQIPFIENTYNNSYSAGYKTAGMIGSFSMIYGFVESLGASVLKQAFEESVITQGHHIIPNQVFKENEAVLNEMGWNQNHPNNLMELPTPFHGNHPAYNNYIGNQLGNILKSGGGLNDIINLQKTTAGQISNILDNGLVERLNQYYKSIGF